jgi:ABC-type multidrug transport system fused ATPase/permease subunit
MQNRTTLIIAHRFSSIAYADQVFVLDKGALVQQGAAQDLFNQDGLYRQLAMAQALDLQSL